MDTKLDILSGSTRILQDYFNCRDEIVAVYLFGSLVGPGLSEESDIDIGLLYQDGTQPGFEEQLILQDDLTQLLQREVDLVVLNQASPILRYQVLKHGICILKHDPSKVCSFFVTTLNEYFDLKMNRQVIERSLRNVRVL